MDPVEFDSLVVNGQLLIEQLEAVELSLNKLNDLDFNELVKDVVQRDSDQIMKNLKIIGTLTTSALNATRVNGILVQDAATNQKGIRFKDLVIKNDVQVNFDIVVDGTVNGVDLSHQLMTPNRHFGMKILANESSIL